MHRKRHFLAFLTRNAFKCTVLSFSEWYVWSLRQLYGDEPLFMFPVVKFPVLLMHV